MTRSSSGLTIFELLLVVVVLAIVMAFVMTSIGGAKEKTYVDAMKNDLRNLASSQEIYFSDQSVYASDPTTLSEQTFTADVFVANSSGDTDSWQVLLGHKKTPETCLLAVGQEFGADNGVMDCTTESLLTVDASNTNPDPGESVTFNAEETVALWKSEQLRPQLAGLRVFTSFQDRQYDFGGGGGLEEFSQLIWSFGDGTVTIGEPSAVSTVTHTYTEPGQRYGVILRASRPDGTTRRASQIITTTGTTTGNQAPSVNISSPPAGATILDTNVSSTSFAGSASDTEDGILSGSSLVWSSDVDGNLGTGGSISVSSLSLGTHQLTLEATDSQGTTGQAAINIEIVENTTTNTAPVADINRPFSGRDFGVGESIPFEGEGTDQEDGLVAEASTAWFSSLDGSLGTGTSFTASNLSSGTHEISLVVTDSDGAADTALATISVTVVGGIVAGVNGEFGSEIQTMTTDGNNRRFVAAGREPAWDPSGSNDIIYISEHNDEITLTDVYGSFEQTLTNLGFEAPQSPAWSPSGTTIAFTASRGGGRKIFTIPSSGATPYGSENQVTPDTTTLTTIRSPVFHPTNGTITFTAVGAQGVDQVWSINRDGTGLTRLTTRLSNKTTPFWHPSGAILIVGDDYFGSIDLWKLDTTTSQWTRMTNAPGSPAPQEFFPRYSPDGSEIMFSRRSRTTGVELLRMVDQPLSTPIANLGGISNYGTFDWR